jgi:hypothetical protein
LLSPLFAPEAQDEIRITRENDVCIAAADPLIPQNKLRLIELKVLQLWPLDSFSGLRLSSRGTSQAQFTFFVAVFTTSGIIPHATFSYLVKHH